jgi:hypothetical protein
VRDGKVQTTGKRTSCGRIIAIALRRCQTQVQPKAFASNTLVSISWWSHYISWNNRNNQPHKDYADYSELSKRAKAVYRTIVTLGEERKTHEAFGPFKGLIYVGSVQVMTTAYISYDPNFKLLANGHDVWSQIPCKEGIKISRSVVRIKSIDYKMEPIASVSIRADDVVMQNNSRVCMEFDRSFRRKISRTITEGRGGSPGLRVLIPP